MIRYEDALELVLATQRSYGVEDVALSAANGRVLAQDVRAAVDVPRFANAQMDGWAVRSADTPGKFVLLRKVFAGEGVAAAPGPHEAIGIMTGAPLPHDCDAVVRIEDVSGTWAPRVEPGNFVRGVGEDFHQGDLVLAAGAQLTPPALMAIAAVGVGQVRVHRRPRIALLATGEELVQPGQPLTREGQIYCASTAYLQAHLPDAVVLPIVPDAGISFDVDADVIVTTGSVSAGDHDVIPKLLAKEKIFHKVAIRPGKPILFAKRGDTVIFGLPGNPVSTAVGYHFFVRPFLFGPLPLQFARLDGAVKKPDELRCFYKASVADGRIRILEGQGSHLIRPMLEANAWAVLPEGPVPSEVQWLPA